MGDYFNRALSDFTQEMASGGAIRHFVDLGYTVDQIKGQLDFPAPYGKIQKSVWEYLIKTGKIRMTEPGSGEEKSEYRFVREQDDCGKTSFRRVKVSGRTERVIAWQDEDLDGADGERVGALSCRAGGTVYMACGFGKTRYQDEDRYRQMVAALGGRDGEYVEGLPWTLETCYHRMDDRMWRIFSCLCEKGYYRGAVYFVDEGIRVWVK